MTWAGRSHRALPCCQSGGEPPDRSTRPRRPCDLCHNSRVRGRSAAQLWLGVGCQRDAVGRDQEPVAMPTPGNEAVSLEFIE